MDQVGQEAGFGGGLIGVETQPSSSDVVVNGLGSRRAAFGCRAGTQRVCMAEIVQGMVRVHERRILPAGCIERRRSPHMLVSDIDQLAENRNFEFQFDAVQRGLEGRLVDIEVPKLDDHQRNIHQDTRDVDGEQLQDSLATNMILIQAQHTICLPHVQPRDDNLLHTEARQLQLLHDIVPRNRGCGTGEVGRVREHGCGHVQQENVHDNHGPHHAQYAHVLNHEVEARIQNEGLAGYHRPPADC